MQYDFDQVIDRRNTNSIKYDFKKEYGKAEDILPLWVADMDFQTPPTVREALHRAVEHGIFGYSEVGREYYEAVAAWFSRHFGWRPEREWLVKTPGVVFAIGVAVRALTEEGDAVLIQQPVYYPFAAVVKESGRRLVNNELRYENGRYSIDFADFEEKIVSQNVKLFILCSPHNPVGRVWTEAELKRMGEICLEHGVRVVSDEIHCDFVRPGHVHTVFASISEAFAEASVICTAPSKTFNLAGLQVSNIWIPNEALRKRFRAALRLTTYNECNTLGLVACQAAYEHGEEWLSQLMAYLEGNLSYVRSFLQDELPQIRLVEPEGTYLAWLDCTGLGLTEEALEGFIEKKAGLWLDGGRMFGNNSGQMQRVNLACPRSVLARAMERLRAECH